MDFYYKDLIHLYLFYHNNNCVQSDDGSTGKEDYIDEDLASFSMGRKLVRENKVEWFPQTKSFLVQAEGGPFVVKMFPRPSCSCKVEQGSCSHVLAIKVGLGIPAKKTKISSIAKVRQHQQSKDDKTAKNRNRGLKDVEIEQPNQENCDADSSELELLKELTKKSKPPFHSKKKNKRATFIEKVSEILLSLQLCEIIFLFLLFLESIFKKIPLFQD